MYRERDTEILHIHIYICIYIYIYIYTHLYKKTAGVFGRFGVLGVLGAFGFSAGLLGSWAAGLPGYRVRLHWPIDAPGCDCTGLSMPPGAFALAYGCSWIHFH